MARCLRAFPSETAPGPTGLRVQQLKDACVAGAAESFLTQLTAVVQLLAHGRAPGFVAPVLGGASLVALPQAYRWCAAHRRWRNSSTIDWQVPHVRGPRRCQSLSLAFASWCCSPQWLGEGSPHRQSLVSPAHWLHNQGVPQT